MADDQKKIEQLERRLAHLENLRATELAQGSKFPTKAENDLRAELANASAGREQMRATNEALKTELAHLKDELRKMRDHATEHVGCEQMKQHWRTRAESAEADQISLQHKLTNVTSALEDALDREEKAKQDWEDQTAELVRVQEVLEAAHPMCEQNVAIESAEAAAELLKGMSENTAALRRELETALNEADMWENRANSIANEFDMWTDRAKTAEAELEDAQNVLAERIAMTLRNYQEVASQTAGGTNRITRAFAGIAGEAGELNEKWKKHLRGDIGHSLQSELRENVKGELGDLLWYCAELASVLDLQLEDIARANLDKLADRASRGVIKGDGDGR